MKTENLKPYRRLWSSHENRFKPRLSYSAYRYFIKNDWNNFFKYLTSQETFSTEKMQKGKEVHEWLEFFGIPHELKEFIKSTNRSVILDYKFGKLSGYQAQLENYLWLLKNSYKGETGSSEIKISVDRKEYEITGVIDYLHLEKDKDFIGMLARVYPQEEGGEIKKVHVTSIKTFEPSLENINKWEDIYYEIYNTILQFIEDGFLNKWLANNQ